MALLDDANPSLAPQTSELMRNTLQALSFVKSVAHSNSTELAQLGHAVELGDSLLGTDAALFANEAFL